jgi:hypothetical protein
VEVTGKVGEIVRHFGPGCSDLALTQRLEALHADAEQAFCYVEEFLGRPIASKVELSEAEEHLSPLATNAPRREWDLWGHKLRARLEAIEELQTRLGR